MKVLLLGYSNFAVRRMLPAMVKNNNVSCIDIATQQPTKIKEPLEKLENIFDDYEKALYSSDAQLVYVSLINSLHAKWVRASIEAGKHVIVDKPASTHFSDLRSIMELAKEKNLFLCEATIWPFHPQISFLKEMFYEQDRILRIEATFSVPKFEKGNFRLEKDFGGGAIWDLGPYAVSIGRVFFNATPKEILARAVSKSESPVDNAFSVLMTYPGERSFVGQFGIDTAYRNRLTLIGEKFVTDVDRVFSTPPSLKNEVLIQQDSDIFRKSILPSDTCENFLYAVFDAIQKKHYTEFRAFMDEDAKNLEALQRAVYDNSME